MHYLKKAVLSGLRLFGRHLPLRRGKWRVINSVLGAMGSAPADVRIVQLTDGRLFCVRLAEKMHRTLYFVGEYEPVETELMRQLVRPGDVALDIGANFGYYTTLLSQLVGPSGAVHSFEPVPPIFAELNFHVGLNRCEHNTHLNQLALSENAESREIYVFAGLPHGHASFSRQGRDDYRAFECRLLTLDQYAADHGLWAVTFVKCDIEGAELVALRGGAETMKRHQPALMFEMNVAACREMGYEPSALLDCLKEAGDYQFYYILPGELRRLSEPDPRVLATHNNILAICSAEHRSRLAGRRFT